MRYGLCDFLIIKPQIALHHTVWCSAVMPFCGRFWCGFCGLVHTPTHVNWWGCVSALLYFPIDLGSYMKIILLISSGLKVLEI